MSALLLSARWVDLWHIFVLFWFLQLTHSQLFFHNQIISGTLSACQMIWIKTVCNIFSIWQNLQLAAKISWTILNICKKLFYFKTFIFSVDASYVGPDTGGDNNNQSKLNLKAPIMTAADNKYCNIFPNFRKIKVWCFMKMVCQQTGRRFSWNIMPYFLLLK